jgi:hypothetical protein
MGSVHQGTGHETMNPIQEHADGDRKEANIGATSFSFMPEEESSIGSVYLKIAK